MRSRARRLRIRYSRHRASESTKLERESKIRCHEKPTHPKCSAQRNRLGAFPGPIESYDPKDGAGKRSSQTNSRLARYVHVKGTKSINNLVTRKIKLSRPPYYSSSRFPLVVGHPLSLGISSSAVVASPSPTYPTLITKTAVTPSSLRRKLPDGHPMNRPAVPRRDPRSAVTPSPLGTQHLDGNLPYHARQMSESVSE